MLILKGRVIDGTGRPPIERGIVAIEENRIIYVCREDEWNSFEDAQIIHVADGTILPGFIEQHCHLGSIGTVNAANIYGMTPYEKTCQAIYDMRRLLDAGFTSVRETGGFANYLKEPVNKGIVTGPRLMASGAIITQTGGHADGYHRFPTSFNDRNKELCILADGVDEVRKACRLQFRSGADFIKTCTTGGVTSQGDSPRHRQYSDSEIKVMVEEAEMHDTYVSAHAMTNAGIKSALRCGVKSIEHATQLDDEAIEMCVKSGAWIVPTFSILDCYADLFSSLPPSVSEKVKWATEMHFESIKKAYKAGIKLGFGADLISDPIVCPYGENNLREFKLLSRIGMSPMEVIMAATKTGSEIIKRDQDVGTLEEGKLADITVCKGNPLANIDILTKIENIKLVILDGKIVTDRTQKIE